jgi:hypothetical protein
MGRRITALWLSELAGVPLRLGVRRREAMELAGVPLRLGVRRRGERVPTKRGAFAAHRHVP